MNSVYLLENKGLIIGLSIGGGVLIIGGIIVVIVIKKKKEEDPNG